MLQPGEVLSLFEGTGAYLKGHFRLTSGLHSPEYLQSALVLQHPGYAEKLGQFLAAQLSSLTPGKKIGLVVSPALGGLIIGHEVARALGASFLFTERGSEGGPEGAAQAGARKMVLRRGFRIEPGAQAVVVEDVITTGGSTREVIDVLRHAGAEVLAAGSIVDRSGGQADLGVPRSALVTLHVKAYEPADCPLCRAGLPATKPGSRPA